MHFIILWGVYTVQQTSSKCNAGRLLEVCWTFAAICYNGAGRLLDRVNTQSVGTNLIHDFTAVFFSVKLAFFREKRRFP